MSAVTHSDAVARAAAARQAAAAEARLRSEAASKQADEARAQVFHDQIVQQGRAKFKLCMEDRLLDYKHNHPMSIDGCASTLVKIFRNVLDNPGEDKYRRVKASSNAFRANIAGSRGGEELLTLAGWQPQVVDMTKYWVFDGQPGSHKFSILYEAAGVLERAQALIHEKAERKRLEKEERAIAEAARVASVRAALEEDKQDRRFKFSGVAAAHDPAEPAVGGPTHTAPQDDSA